MRNTLTIFIQTKMYFFFFFFGIFTQNKFDSIFLIKFILLNINIKTN